MKRWLSAHIGTAWMLGIFAFLYAPLAYLLLFSFNSTRQDAVFTGFSLRWYQALAQDSRIVEGFLLSLKVAVTAASLSAILATFAAFVLVAAACSQAWSVRPW